MNYVKPVFRGIDKDKTEFKHSSCLLTISVGQEVHEGDKFISTLELINTSFKSCVILVDDSLQRHTMALNTPNSPESYYEQSIIEGDLWLKRNQAYIDKLTNLDRIIRWDQWLFHPQYNLQKQIIEENIKKDSSYADCFEKTIDEFLFRYFRRLINEHHNYLAKAKELCFDYLVEECTALCLWTETNCQFEVYPSYRNAAMAETHRRFVLDKDPTLLRAVAIKFKNRKQLKPQTFTSALAAEQLY